MLAAGLARTGHWAAYTVHVVQTTLVITSSVSMSQTFMQDTVGHICSVTVYIAVSDTALTAASDMVLTAADGLVYY